MKNLLNLGKTLNKAEQKSVFGGFGSCAYYNGVTGEVSYLLTSSQAQGMLNDASDHWCCNSCDSASWFVFKKYEEAMDEPR
ncbi:hypothetical protein [Winogradskyella sp. PE311]|uniref:hypothetical protein n=1 Tax=Winogradskyella sp. PE311 TaxID=3366943 RepID=UPI0039800481